MTKFLSKENWHNFIWAIIGAAVLGLFGLIWNWWQGPAEVLVVNKNNSKDTTVTIVQIKPDTSYLKEVSKLLAQNIKPTKEYSIPKNASNSKIVTDNSKEIALNYQKIFDSLIFLASKNNVTQKKDSSPFNAPSVKPSSANPNVAKITRPKFKIPSIVSGYTQGGLNSLARVNVEALTVRRKDFVEINLDFLNSNTLSDITPIFVDLSEKTSPNSYYQMFSEQFTASTKSSKILFSADFKPKTYVLTVGFYFVNEINSKFPPFYFKQFSLTIID